VTAIDPLARYNAKRDFKKTAEPAGQSSDRRTANGGHRFLVQKHDATRLHYDFRLELDGVLKSWAVTRGPSPNPEDKRLAVRTEDHPLAYADFEGTIPKGEYGGGTVMLWDEGTWEPAPGKDPSKTIEEGHLHFTLHGRRMKGEWILIRLKPRAGERGENWLLRKVEDDHAGASGDLVDKALTSVRSERTMVQIAEGKSVWHSNRKADDQPEAKPAPSSSSRRRPGSSRATSARTATAELDSGLRRNDGKEKRGARSNAPLPAFRPPQLATLVDQPPTGTGWIHEVKYDGYRCLLAVAPGTAKAYTRSGQDWSDRFATIVAAAAHANIGPALIDGEVVALGADGKPNFQALQASIKEGSGDFAYFAFDLIEEDGEDLAALPNIERKRRLQALLDGVSAPIRYAEHVETSGETMLKALCGEGYEGIVSKRADAPYRGRRTQAWLKIKCTRRQEFVIVGWTPSDKSGRRFRSLLLGVHDSGGLRYAGKVGTGFNADTAEMLMERMRPLARDTATVEAPRAAVRGAQWISPKLVAEIAFTETTDDGVLRHPSFLGLREDKPATEVVVETPEPVAEAKKAAPSRAKKAGDDKPFGVAISNRDRVVYPESGITKGQLADYYAAVAAPMLEWLAHRPVSLVRCPQGRAKHCFFQKHDAGSFGDAVKHVPIREKDGHEEPYLYVDDGTGLMTCVQMGTIEFHGWGSLADDVEAVDRLVFDLDPDEGLGFEEVKRAAVQLRDVLGEMGLVSDPMLSGGKGVHVVVPLDRSKRWPEVKDFAHRFAEAMASAHPERFTANMKKVQRTGRIFLDWLRNQRGATAVLPYSARARPKATVAAPITWDELDGLDAPGRYTIADAEELVKRAGSKALKSWARTKQALPDF